MSRLRIDRLVTLYLVHPLLESTSSARLKRIAVLMYHSISAESVHHVHPYYETTTTPRVFERQMSFLKQHRYRITDLAEAVGQMETEEPIESTVVITFDDGYRDFYTHAFPVLNNHGFSATVFLPTGFVDGVRTFKGMECLTWSQVRELHAAGVAFGSHTVTHRQLAQVEHAEVSSEIRQSKDTIEQELGAHVDSFSYPYAFPEHDREFRLRLRAALEQAGYLYGVTTIIGTLRGTHDRYFLKRLPVSDWDDTRLLRAKLDGGYDWLHGLQYATKMVRARLG